MGVPCVNGCVERFQALNANDYCLLGISVWKSEPWEIFTECWSSRECCMVLKSGEVLCLYADNVYNRFCKTMLDVIPELEEFGSDTSWSDDYDVHSPTAVSRDSD